MEGRSNAGIAAALVVSGAPIIRTVKRAATVVPAG
jgi:hypothetical protein